MNHPMHRVVSFAIVGPHELEVEDIAACLRFASRRLDRGGVAF